MVDALVGDEDFTLEPHLDHLPSAMACPEKTIQRVR